MWEKGVTDPFCRSHLSSHRSKGWRERRYPENPDGNGVWPGEVLHGDHQLMRPARFAAPTFEIYERGFEKRSLATTGALVKLARSFELARAQTCISMSRCARGLRVAL